jgi:hypothetical protein
MHSTAQSTSVFGNNVGRPAPSISGARPTIPLKRCKPL